MSFKKLVASYKKNINYDGSNSKTEYQNSYKDNLIDSFFDNIAWTKVSKNFTYDTLYDTWIFEGDTKDKEVPYKRLLSYPYDQIQFSRGDYLHFIYGNESTTWLLTTLESQFNYDVNGRIYRCNETLRWYDSNGVLQEYPCVIEDKLSQGLFDFNPNIILPTGVIYVQVQYNEDTQKIVDSDRFLFKGQAFKTTFVNPFTAGNCMTLTMQKDQLGTNDDTVNNIADINKYVYELTINQSSFEAPVGATGQLTATVKLNNNQVNVPVEWISSDETLATINADTGEYEILSTGGDIEYVWMFPTTSPPPNSVGALIDLDNNYIYDDSFLFISNGTGLVVFSCRMKNNTSVSDSIDVQCTEAPVNEPKVLLEPLVYSINQNQSQTYEVYLTIGDVIQPDEFEVSVSGVPSDYYSLEVLSGNSFKISNLKGYYTDALVVNCVSGEYEHSFEINLKGLW